MLKSILTITFLILSGYAQAQTALNAKNILGKYTMNGVVDLKVNLLTKNKVEAVQVGIIFDTKCDGTYAYNQNKNELIADLDCEGSALHQQIEFANTTMEDLKNGTLVHVALFYNNENYDLDFDIKKIQ
jgi:hypothetical protein